VVSIVNQLRKNHPEIQIGVITFYSAQVEKLKEKLGQSSQSVTVSTVDGFQGGECDCIIVSCVRANPNGRVGFVEDPRRINVALTRARFGLIILGHVKTLVQSTHILKNIIDDASERDKLLDESVLDLKTKPKKQGAEFCRFFAKGDCHYGNRCKFPHVKPPEEETLDIRNLLGQTNIGSTAFQKK
jgi:hypothetical protein